MLKIGMNRRRTKAQVEEEKEEALLREQSMQAADQQSKLLRDRITELEAESRNNNSAAGILNNLLAQGVARQDENGEIYVPSASKERPQ